jgi:aminoglycoside phosphotransferase (APT) family kinase protein
MMEGNQVIVVDFDSAAMGDPASDLSSFVAGIEFDTLLGRIPPARAENAIGEFLDAYGRASGRRLSPIFNIHVAASLLRLAPFPFRNRYSDWHQLTHKVIDLAETAAGASRVNKAH